MAVAGRRAASLLAPSEPPAPGVFISLWQDTYDSSRLVLVELITRLDVRGDPVALLPHRDISS